MFFMRSLYRPCQSLNSLCQPILDRQQFFAHKSARLLLLGNASSQIYDKTIIAGE